MGKFIGAMIALVLSAVAAPASAITWTDWTTTGPTTVTGTVNGVTVTYSGSYGFAQTNGGTDYWTPRWDGTIAPPPPSDIIALSAAGAKSITFSSSVTDVYLALNSWNGQSATFDKPFTTVGFVNGCGYWGCGLPTNVTSTSFSSPGELHGILKFAGPITSLSFTDTTDEFWHGIQVGVGSITATAAVPEPATWAMFLLGFGIIGGAIRTRRSRALAIV